MGEKAVEGHGNYSFLFYSNRLNAVIIIPFFPKKTQAGSFISQEELFGLSAFLWYASYIINI
ncbi:hypothetical protein HMPREF0494_1720 [Limosilactobacillus antri DSM 16041]|uniref:Uncharacterized protein n=1 Tax=Limosilactobacillus antri DSM 16041 TaxID=525309 RepID=C8P8S6_9LACO|nr:hypothetical protein HMPREF0494_1720 [Limosilactobacillus antri DSM 16041]